MQNLIQMLKEYNIKNIVSVDDEWEKPRDFVAKMEAQGLEQDISIREYCETYAIDVDKGEEIPYREIETGLLSEIDAVKFRIPKLYDKISSNLEVERDRSLETLKNILKQLTEQEDLKIYFDVKFKNEFKKLVGNTLYILDKDMGKDREDEFLSYILDITDQRAVYHDLIIVYSNEVADLLTHDKKVQYLKKNNAKGREFAILYQFWPVSKIADESSLICKIKEMISKSMYGKALSKMVEMKQESVRVAFDELLEIDIDNLDDMIIESFIEGEKVTDSYESLLDSLIRKAALEQITASNVLDYEKGLIQYESRRAKEILKKNDAETDKKYNRYRNEICKKKVIESVQKETMLFNIADYSVNNEFLNPSMGDIYVFTDARNNKKYAGMLISQECSTIIRKGKYSEKPRRSAQEFLLLLFDIIEILDKNITESVINKLDECIWPIKIDGKITLLKNTKRSMYVCPQILDLCGLSVDGRARIKFEEKSLEYKSVYSQEYYKDIKTNIETEIQNIVNEVSSQNGLQGTDSNIKNMVVSLAFGIVFKDDFELRRICKVDEKQALHIIHEYLNGIAKIGLSVVPNV